jgi:hypothetical protein
MRVQRQRSTRILRRAANPIAALAVALFAAGCSGSSDDEGSTSADLTAPDAATCSSSSLGEPCSPPAIDQIAEDDDDEELNRDELERELDRIEQEISAPEP